MTDSKKPKPGTLEFEEWEKEKLKKNLEGLFQKPADFDESQGIAGHADTLSQTDSDLYTDQLKEKTPSERRKLIQEIKKANSNQQTRDN